MTFVEYMSELHTRYTDPANANRGKGCMAVDLLWEASPPLRTLVGDTEFNPWNRDDLLPQFFAFLALNWEPTIIKVQVVKGIAAGTDRYVELKS